MTSPLVLHFFSDLPISPAVIIVILVFVGELLLFFDMFIFPGIGAGDIVGGLMMIGAAVMAGMNYGLLWGMGVFFFSAVIAFAGLLYGMKNRQVQKRFVLSTVKPRGKGTIAEELSGLKGHSGTAVTALRPAGIARIGTQRVDVISEGSYIDAGTPIEVVLVEGPRVVVREKKD